MRKKLQIFMAIKRANIAFYLCLFGFIVPSYAIIDNRWRDPALNNKVFIVHDPEASTVVELQPFVETAHHAFGCDGETGLFAISFPYNLSDLDKALVATGRTSQSLTPSYWLGVLTQGRFAMTGHLQTQGLAFHVRHQFAPHWEFGVRGEGLHVNSRLTLIKDQAFDRGLASQGNQRELTLLQESIHKALELQPALWNDIVLGDIEAYMRLFVHKNYAYKCRFIDAGITFGMILPAAPARDIFNPASVPMGGNRHWGWFLEADVDALLRYDMRAGFNLRVQKRFARVDRLRVMYDKEPSMYGAVIGDFYVDPGVTVMFSPYFIQEGLREGFGVRVAYMGVKHFTDNFSDRRCDRSVDVNFEEIKKESKWGKDYVSLSFLYDFAYGKTERCFEPVIALTADVPVDFWATERSAKTYGIAFALEMNF